ncbi:cellular communication network factor 1, like 2 [Brachyhypopomus gauderio]|uniref:cellular communication network factor 1, like 2 n=1 Tax=Brachyhypopomus gauderio TaxID=698409 RepID=UPI00404339D3
METVLGIVLLMAASVCAADRMSGGCSAPCSCPPSPPSCPVGVSWVLDECGCCKVCAQQFNQDCGPDKPCDHIKGLHCHLGAGGDPYRGVCRAAAHGRPCEFGGQVVQHGEDFQLRCEHRCSCTDGVVGCVPVCPQPLLLPRGHCASPRLETPPGHCCQSWVCDDDNHIREDTPPPLPHSHANHIGMLVWPPGARRANGDAFQEWAGPAVWGLPSPSSECYPQTTDWSRCSSPCGFGISSRVTNSNPRCKLVRETRLCQVRKCDVTPVVRRGKKCVRAARSREPEHITFAGCSTVRRYRPRTCGSCSDGRCCRPSESRTVRMRFRCPDGESVTRNVMWIRRCRCGRRHCDGDEAAPSVSLRNDVHTFSR